jgi:hypothetical protein
VPQASFRERSNPIFGHAGVLSKAPTACRGPATHGSRGGRRGDPGGQQPRRLYFYKSSSMPNRFKFLLQTGNLSFQQYTLHPPQNLFGLLRTNVFIMRFIMV